MSDIDDMEALPTPTGELVYKTITLPKDCNFNGDIYGGWLVSQMDLAGSSVASRIAMGRVATVAIDRMAFMMPLELGSQVSFYSEVTDVGRSSVTMTMEVWANNPSGPSNHKVTEGAFVFVAIDSAGRTRSINSNK